MEDQKFFVEGFESFAPNVTPYERILAIGDVHGAVDRLESLLKKISVTDKDLVIFLGDYFDFSSKNKKNLETLLRLSELSARKNFIFLLGNTDEDAMKVFSGIKDDSSGIFFMRFYRNEQKLYDDNRDKNVPKKLFDFLNSLRPSHIVEVGGRKYFFCHAGIKFDKPLELQNKDYVIGKLGCASFYRNYAGNDVIVVGHKSPNKLSEQFDGNKPLKVPSKNILMLDTRAKKKDGKLSCVDILSGQYWQS